MDKSTIENHINDVLEKTDFSELGERKQGKVRDVYVQDDKLILVATDRYSAFDRNLALIPFKGQVLTEISKFWFEKTENIIRNHILDFPDPNAMVVKKCDVVPVEVIVRGYISGVTATSTWTLYQKGERKFGGVTLPEGMKKNQKFAHPIITPTTKFEAHDRPLTKEEIVNSGMVNELLWKEIEEVAIKLFTRGQEIALQRGLILVDTKYEFGTDSEGKLMLIDEIHTPDSSRYWQAESYESRIAQGQEPENFDKEFLRIWFKEHCDPYKDGVLPEAPREMVVELSSRYIRIFEQLTGNEFGADFSIPVLERIRKNLAAYAIT
ncbi:MAG: phosphoribosylaminoimidazolesuccinocarboxamide synthase [Candidatus Liptonbacteria bacterium]|nr:phosphoribosylaminoimidazolesuccinocarboxamide synthase [Candidatus Liptonbacteria bacterium]